MKAIFNKTRRLCLFVISLAFVMTHTGCCESRKARHTQPKYPTYVSGWVDDPRNRGFMQGLFVLKKGESTEKGKLGVKVAEISPETCPSPFAKDPVRAKVVLQFYDPSSKAVLCEPNLSDNTVTMIAGTNPCFEKVAVTQVGVTAINTEQNWAAFYLQP